LNTKKKKHEKVAGPKSAKILFSIVFRKPSKTLFCFGVMCNTQSCLERQPIDEINWNWQNVGSNSL